MERYKVVLSSSKFYREIELEPNAKMVRIGTLPDCVVRLERELFFDNFSFCLESANEAWRIQCGENHYVSEDGVLKLSAKQLAHGDSLRIKDSRTNAELLTLTFTLDFEYETKDYERVFDIAELASFSIGGGTGCDIELHDALIGRDVVHITNKGGKLTIKDQDTQYGVYVNGLRIQEAVEIGDCNFFSILGFSFYYKFGKLYTQKTVSIYSETIPNQLETESDGRFCYPVFNRNTRIKVQVPKEEIPILDPPPLPEKSKQNILLNLLPTVAMMGVTVMLASQSGGGPMMAVRSVAMVGVSILVAIVGIISAKNTQKKEIKHRDAVYRAYIEKKREEIQSKRTIEKGALEEIYPSAEQEQVWVHQFSSDLFNRVPEDDDFLQIRLGTGAVVSTQKVAYKEQETLEIGDELTQMPSAVANEFRELTTAPIVVDGKSSSAVGVVGARPRLYEMFKNILLDIVTRQFYDDVQVFVMMEDEHAPGFTWLRHLPHLCNPHLGVRNIICDEESKNVLFEYLYKEFARRKENSIATPHIVVMSYSDQGMKSHPISNYFKDAVDINVTFFFFEEKKYTLPLGCSQIILLQSNDSSGTLVAQEDDTAEKSFSYTPIEDAQAMYFARKLAPVYLEEVSLENNLTKSITLYELLGIYSPLDLDLQSRWTTSQIHKTMAAPLGVDSKKDVICLDLHEKFHGPHGLVAGTTGSGKSEILQSYILSMASLFHPYEVGFVIIDFKGGGMVNQFKDLPHLNGAITNIDGREINRSLLSIKAELKKRQALFSQANVNHINAYIQLFKKGEVSIPLPHLILIVDEFAELKMDQPEFMKELISAARIGRSLGVHLILATQKPSGVVDDQIWSNSKFKLCLKVQNQQDSNEVLKSPLAAEIREPGRAYLQVGNNEVFLLFQSAYSGAPAVNGGEQKSKFHINELSLWGKGKTIFEYKPEKASQETQTQLSALVQHIQDYAEKNGIQKLQGICLPPLSEVILYDKKADIATHIDSISVAMGIYDDPTTQSQPPYRLDMLMGNTFIIGASQFGKTNMLQLIIRDLAEQYSPGEVSFYIMDFASTALKVFDTLPHVGGVIVLSEDVKLKTFFRMMTREIGQRKDKLSKMGLASFAAYREAGARDLPLIVILLDNITAFREFYESYDDEFLNICREGLAVGISVVVTTVQTRSLGYKYLSNFGNRIALYCNSKDEYASLFEHCRMEPKAVPGRALILCNKELYECQNYLPFEGEKEIDRVTSIRRFIAEMQQCTENVARRIPEVPEVLTVQQLKETTDCALPFQFTLGIDYDTVEPVRINALKAGYLAVSGREKSGKGNFVRYLFSCMQQEKAASGGVQAIVIDGYERKFEALKHYGFVTQYSTEMEDLDRAFRALHEECAKRREAIKKDGLKALDSMPLLVLAIQNAQFFEQGGLSKEGADTCKTIMKLAKDVKMFLIFSNLENAPIPYGGTEVQKQIKETKNVVFFDDLAAFKPFDLNMGDLRVHRKPIELGDAFFVQERSIVRMKTPLVSQTEQ